MNYTRTAALAAVALLPLTVGCKPLDAVTSSTVSPSAPSDAAAQLAELEVVPEWTGDYDRDRWHEGWHELDGTHNCDARELALRQQGSYINAAGEKAGPARYDHGNCEVYEPGAPELDGGHNQWVSRYDGEVITNPSETDADHLIPLVETAESGGHAWPEKRKHHYANHTVIWIVSASSNRSKSGSGPAEWMPSQGQCAYAVAWIGVKHDQQLSVDQAEKRALTDALNTCDTEGDNQ